MTHLADENFKLALNAWIKTSLAVTSIGDGAEHQLEHANCLWIDGKQIGFAEDDLIALLAPGLEPLATLYDAAGAAPSVCGSLLEAYRAFVRGAVMVWRTSDRVQ